MFKFSNRFNIWQEHCARSACQISKRWNDGNTIGQPKNIFERKKIVKIISVKHKINIFFLNMADYEWRKLFKDYISDFWQWCNQMPTQYVRFWKKMNQISLINSLRPSDAYISKLTIINECWNIVNWTLRNKFHLNFNQNSLAYFHSRKCIWKYRLPKW